MPLESATYINGLNASNPTGADTKAEGDDHIRLIKSAVKATFPNLTGAVTADQTELNILDGATLSTAELNLLDGVTASTAELNLLDGVTATTTEINYIDGVTSPIQTQLAGKADITGENYTGTHDFSGATAVKAPTKSPGSAGNDVATVDYANSLAFSSALPALTGNALKVLRVNAGATSGEWVDYIPTPAGNEGKPLAVNSSGASAWISPQSTWSLWSLITTNNGTFTVPDGITAIRAYAFGKGGDGSANGTGGAGGAGGSCAFGTIPCKPGDVFTFTNTSGIATLSKGATAYLTAPAGGDASGTTAGAPGGVGTIGSGLGITSSGGYAGGAGCLGGFGSSSGGGGSSGSPLGTGFSATSSGGAGWGAGGTTNGGGGVAANPTGYFLGGPAPLNSTGSPTSRDWTNAFVDPLLRFCNGVAAPWAGAGVNSTANVAGSAPAGCGGDRAVGSGANLTGGDGGLGGGGGPGLGTNGAGGKGGFGGGGGNALSSSTGGSSTVGGGGGGSVTGTAGTGGQAAVIIFYA